MHKRNSLNIDTREITLEPADNARLFEHYQTHPDELPPDYQDIRLREGTDRAVCDYIAGMTDHYAVAKYNEAFVPLAWAVK